MLGKLMKHEWKGTCRMGALMLIVMVGVTLLGWLSFQSPVWRTMANDITYESTILNIMDLMSFFTLFLYAILLMAVPVGMVVYLAVRFYRTMYTDEGYLIHTLPVSKHQILVSKIIIGAVWELLISLAVVVSAICLGLFMMRAILPDGYTLAEMWNEFYDEIGESLVMVMEEGFGMNLTAYLIYIIVSLIVSPVTSVAILFGAISMGQLFAKHRVLMAIVCYFGLLFANGILGSILEGIITAAHSGKESLDVVGSYINVNMISSLVLSILVAIGMYFAAHYVNEKKLNME